MKYSRRFFIKLSTPLLLTFLPFNYLLAKRIKNEESHLFLDESNVFSNNDNLFIIGLLHSTDFQKSTDSIAYLRSINNYRSELTYRSTDKYKVQFSKDLIDYFFQEPTLKFSSRVISGRFAPSRKDYYSKKESSYHLHYNQIIRDAMIGDNSIMHLEKRSIYTDEKLVQFLIKRYNTSIEHVHYPKSDLSQLSDLFTGCINGDTISISNSSKVEILEYLKNKLEIKQFTELYNKDGNEKFKIIKTQI